jgi:hypothetical protein
MKKITITYAIVIAAITILWVAADQLLSADYELFIVIAPVPATAAIQAESCLQNE